ncbi:probable auxin efflux carrier component 8 [Argentina anserina]|uniref:probable auxin efflux carrier component 8 n=1 Tax=Argentina anserina TaxID=57926 RepID=UPI0021763800|nr:probable auxin efflux carrier component 8 [Potentilla anserina]
MISLLDVYHVVAATVPLYVAMIIAYVSVKWWKLFTPEQCSGINKFVAKFSIPLLSFQVISANNPYKMNLKLILADGLQKAIAFLALTAITKFSSHGGLNSIITGLSLSTLPNTLILGIPLLKAMYAEEAGVLVSQIVVLQSLVWYNLLLFLFEFRAAKAASVTPSSDATAEDVEAPNEAQLKDEEGGEEGARNPNKMKSILSTVVRKLFANPNTHATILSLIWASIHFRWGVKMPEIVTQSISILANGGLGMATFSLGLFMASRPSIIACGTRMTVVAMVLKFLAGPAVMALSSFAVGLRGRVLRVAIVQAALPQGIVPFVFAKEYNVHPEILSTAVIFGMLIALPIALAYYFLMGL